MLSNKNIHMEWTLFGGWSMFMQVNLFIKNLHLTISVKFCNQHRILVQYSLRTELHCLNSKQDHLKLEARRNGT